jgi:hypothetical protein
MLRRHRPSPAFVLAFAALLVALTGSAFAAGVPAQIARAISGKSLRNGSVTGVKLKRNTLTGREINENKLGVVPRAHHAGVASSAGTAITAGNVGGVTMRRISFVAKPSTGSTQILSLNGINLFGSCSATGNPALVVQSATTGGDLRDNVIQSPTITRTGSDQSFDSPQTFDLTRALPSGIGTLQFLNKTNGQTVTASYAFHGGSKKASCVYGGTAWAG